MKTVFLLLLLALSTQMSFAQTPSPNPAAAQVKPRDYPKDPPPEEPQPAKWPAELRVVGNRLQDAAGREVWLQGVNVISLEIDPPGHGVLQSSKVALEEWKGNVIRLPIKDEFWYGKGQGKRLQTDGGAAYRALVDAAVTLAANRRAYLIIDHHRYRALRTEHVAFWQEVARRYKNHPAVLFDIINEPHGISWDVWRNGGFVAEKPKQADESAFLPEAEKQKNNAGFTSPGMQKVVEAIRATGAKNIIVAGGLDWAYDLSGVVNGFALEDKSGNGIMYSTHIYPWKKGWATKVLPAAAKFPILVGEVGADVLKMPFLPLEVQEDPYTWVPDMLGLIQQHKLHWTGWSFHAWATPVMISDWKFTPTPFWGAYAKRALAGEQFPPPAKLR